MFLSLEPSVKAEVDQKCEHVRRAVLFATEVMRVLAVTGSGVLRVFWIGAERSASAGEGRAGRYDGTQDIAPAIGRIAQYLICCAFCFEVSAALA
jgi:hypothetical protein